MFKGSTLAQQYPFAPEHQKVVREQEGINIDHPEEPVVITLPPFLARSKTQADQARGYTVLPNGEIGKLTKGDW